jgi:xanthosine utilization system XapX-like protein
LDQHNLPIKMKSNILLISAVLAVALVAALLTVSVTTAGIVAALCGLLAIGAADYGRNLEPLRPEFRVSQFNPAESRSVELSEAA